MLHFYHFKPLLFQIQDQDVLVFVVVGMLFDVV